jgi:uncharacterized protein DUF4157
LDLREMTRTMFLRASHQSSSPQRPQGGAGPPSPQSRRARPPLANQALQRLLRLGPVQAKLAFNQPGDRFEQEAERVADAVMRMPEPRNAAKMGTSGATLVPALQCMCPKCEEEEQGSPPPVQRLCSECGHKKPEEEASLQAKEIPGGTPEVTPTIQARIAAIRGGGQPLPEPVRSFFEPRFGHDFGNVRVHADSAAAETARSINALAFTTGNHIVFASGQYAPGAGPSRRLLAHELTHTIQQGHAAPSVQRVPAPPSCPAVPTATPATCPDRHTAYCAAPACFPTNTWLPCVCTASGQVCDAADAFSFTGAKGVALAACAAAPPTAPFGPIMRKGAWFLSTNRCIWRHWRTALDALHDPTLPIPSGVTAEWSTAIATCRTSGVGSKACCEAHVVAEQNAIDRCTPYNSRAFGPLPTDVPGAPLCSRIVAAFAPPPAFTGDFGNVADRITYGKSRCCP